MSVPTCTFIQDLFDEILCAAIHSDNQAWRCEGSFWKEGVIIREMSSQLADMEHWENF